MSVTKMCEIVMPGMVNRRSGVVINISSASALLPSPMLTVYAATKVGIIESTNKESSSYGILTRLVSLAAIRREIFR